MGWRPSATGAPVATIALALAVCAPGWAKSYDLGRTQITAEVRADGSMHVREARDYVFSGSFHHAYRIIPLPSGTAVANFVVSEGGRYFRQSAARPATAGRTPGYLPGEPGRRLLPRGLVLRGRR